LLVNVNIIIIIGSLLIRLQRIDFISYKLWVF
jgi:hypothetical protein